MTVGGREGGEGGRRRERGREGDKQRGGRESVWRGRERGKS